MSLNGAIPTPMSEEGQAGELIQQLMLRFMQVRQVQGPRVNVPEVVNASVLPATRANNIATETGQVQPTQENAGQTVLWMLASASHVRTPNMEAIFADVYQRFYTQPFTFNEAQNPREQDSDQEMAENGQVQDLSQAVRQLRM
jgi:hypothetical protein